MDKQPTVIRVTRPFRPDRATFDRYIDSIWHRNWWTNNGPLVQEFERQLIQFLGVDDLAYVNNGTIALQIAIKALELEGEVITTPFSYVATTSSLVWEGCQPVFVDIDPATFNIDPTNIAAAITPKTSAILATHIFGNACDVEAIQSVADQHGLKVIYDAAHCFGVEVNGRSVFSYGDISITSFHATKLLHSIEGGGIFSSCPELMKKIKLLRNFGHLSPETFGPAGINGKASEIHAAMGLSNLRHIKEIMARRRQQFLQYRSELAGLSLRFPHCPENVSSNYAYFAVVFGSEAELLQVKATLELSGVYPRRYFYPSLSSLPYLASGAAPTPVADTVASSVLCLPLYHDLATEEILRICHLIKNALC